MLTKVKKFFLVIALLTSSAIYFQHCQKNGNQDNFILITLDTQRADHISSYSNKFASTPNIDSLATKGILFENCYSLIPITMPSHASIFFSQQPYFLKVYNNGQKIEIVEKRPSLASVFQKKGFETAAFVSLGVFGTGSGMNEGFAHYEAVFPKGKWYLTAEEINKMVLPWLKENKNERFFLWVHYSDPHEPYSPPNDPNDFKIYLNNQLIYEFCLNKNTDQEITINLQRRKNQLRFEVVNHFKKKRTNFEAIFFTFEFSPEPDQNDLKVTPIQGLSFQNPTGHILCEERALIDIESKESPRAIKLTFRGVLMLDMESIRDQYIKEVEYMDGEIGKLFEYLEKLDLFDKTNILMVGDHGEGLGEYKDPFGMWHAGHIHYLYDVYTKVPLIIYSPDFVQRGQTKREYVSLLDMAPTVMDLMGFKKLSFYEGRSLLSPKIKEVVTILQETYKPEAHKDKFALLKFPWHLILTPETKEYELFNLRADPFEKENIYQKNHLPQEVISLKKNLDSASIEIIKGKKEIKTDKKFEEMLRALGYIK